MVIGPSQMLYDWTLPLSSDPLSLTIAFLSEWAGHVDSYGTCNCILGMGYRTVFKSKWQINTRTKFFFFPILWYKKIEKIFKKITNLVEFTSWEKKKCPIFFVEITKFVKEKHSHEYIAIYGILVETKLST
jgi:UDP-galactopyranose mutase